jgi:hypothetical protein
MRADFRQCCAYCLMHELWAHGEENFQLDHFRPVSRFPGLEREFLNLYYACYPCNHIKRAQWPTPEQHSDGYGFVDFCRHDLDDHFEEAPDGTWRPLTRAGEFTLEALNLNRPHLVEIRLLLRQLGLPYSEPAQH